MLRHCPPIHSGITGLCLILMIVISCTVINVKMVIVQGLRIISLNVTKNIAMTAKKKFAHVAMILIRK